MANKLKDPRIRCIKELVKWLKKELNIHSIYIFRPPPGMGFGTILTPYSAGEGNQQSDMGRIIFRMQTRTQGGSEEEIYNREWLLYDKLKIINGDYNVKEFTDIIITIRAIDTPDFIEVAENETMFATTNHEIIINQRGK